MLVDLRDSELDGQQAEDRLHRVGITVNRNAVPFEPRPPMVSSGVRIGTSSLAKLGFDLDAFAEVADVISHALRPAPMTPPSPNSVPGSTPSQRASRSTPASQESRCDHSNRATRRTPPRLPQNLYGTTTHKNITMFLFNRRTTWCHPTPPIGHPNVATWSLLQACWRLASMTVSQIAETRK